MKGTYLKFYVQENRIHDHTVVYEWLLELAQKLGIGGGSAFRAISGFGRHGLLNEDLFAELAGDLPVEVAFMVSDEEAELLLKAIRSEGLALFYIRMPAEYGITSNDTP